MVGSLDAVNAAFMQLDRRPAVFDREIREHVGRWRLSEPVPATHVIESFKRNAEFILDDEKVVLPLHEPDSADLTGEFLIYYPDFVVPCVVYHDFSTDELAKIPVEDLGETYPAWRLRFWHPDYEPPTEPAYALDADAADPADLEPDEPVESGAPLPDDGEALLEELRAMITDQEMAEREDARRACERLPTAQFLADRGGIEGLVAAGTTEDAYGQQLHRFHIPDERLDGPVDVTDEYGIYPGSEVLVDTGADVPGFPAEADVVNVEGRQLELSFYWDRGPENPDLDVFELDLDNRFVVGELLNPVPHDRKREAVRTVADDERKRGWLSGTAGVGFRDGFDVSLSKARLNKFQYEAAYGALTASDVFCIHGPPGTGKTRTLVEIVRAACADGNRVLAVSHSNQAVDNLLVGDSTPDQPDPSSIHAAVEDGDLTAARAGDRTSNDLVAERYAGNDLYQSDVVCATMSAAHRFGEDIFEYAVVDEATQATIPDTLIPAAGAKRLVLAGDHKQLPPYQAGEDEGEEAMVESLFDHLLELYGDDVAARLRTQYRMHEAIAAFPNAAFYDGALSHGQRNRTWSIAPLDPLDAVHVEGREERSPANSYYNEAEAAAVADEVARLLDVGVTPDDVGVITPYSGQIGKIRAALARVDHHGTDRVKVATVDAFQGSEREAIAVSFVRSNPDGHSGFLTFPNEGPRRLTVALTRARKRCVLVGNFDTLRTRPPGTDPSESAADVYQRLYDHLEETGTLSQPERSIE
jgi:hypothetical protein